MHSFADRGTVHELILKGCPLERLELWGRKEQQQSQTRGTVHRFSYMRCLTAGDLNFLSIMYSFISAKIAFARSPWLVIVSCCRILLHPIVSLFYSILFFCQSKSNILRYLKPVLFIKLSLNQYKVSDCNT